uniref:glutathione gamma-glutamylcysteinyltransferase n=1 Tax=Helicotheca tamesis TaxID=374047 RepID=A0A7S2MPQ3_9STRA|mmetsp:Transcript_19578/g.26878  ORF Transcript_19578/g.26878 Transcript_19578/m.26878 type:complete len:529 (+) Transcript_19578:18-1604(+)|eukprot:CAMPEP_0185738816 /NCGR_PEP_ID=MMETSP1171-20130828/33953_1 /TAXON_ID=374046 /ORGANISM="Helicotheca tamensis, Strain CCMP826" /LENGTH=528 /DNA_ID=CAMNT_0028410183 /DNA_START=8 /DNA_END=1594 /DNA_ORIENTATION=+
MSSSQPSSLGYNSITQPSTDEKLTRAENCNHANDSPYESYHFQNNNEDEEEQSDIVDQNEQDIRSKIPATVSKSSLFLFSLTFVGGVATGKLFFNVDNTMTKQQLFRNDNYDENAFGWMSLESLIKQNKDNLEATPIYSSLDLSNDVKANLFLDLLPHEAYNDGNNDEGEKSTISAHHIPRYRAGPPLLYMRNDVSYNLLYDRTIRSISQYSSDYFLITAGWDAQINQAYCGPASVAAVLNSLRFGGAFGPTGAGGSVSGSSSPLSGSGATVALPVDSAYSPYKYATQNDLFGSCTTKHVVPTPPMLHGDDALLIPPYGLSLAQVTKMLQCHFLSPSYDDPSTPSSSTSRSSSSSTTLLTSDIQDDDAILTENSDFSVKLTYLDKTHVTLGKMRFDLRTALKDRHSRVLVGYNRKTLGQVGGGHISPLGSYHAPTDTFLIMDVSKYKYPPVWVTAIALYDAMATSDDCGQWNFPDAQTKLTDEMRHPFDQSKDDLDDTDEQGMKWYEEAMQALGCKSTPRGYIVVARE